MSDDAVYSNFLDQANKHTKPQQSTQSENATLYLTSESDEPWVPCSGHSSSPLSAENFAEVVNRFGEVEEVSMDDRPDYAPVLATFKDRNSDRIQVFEITRGTRIYVYVVQYDPAKKEYKGMQSMRVES